MQTKTKFSDQGRKGTKKDTIIFGGKERIPSVRIVQNMEETILDQEWAKKNRTQPLYYMYRDLAENYQDAEKIKKNNLRFDILDSVPVSLGEEYNKTAGHYHSRVAGTNFTYPELYELINGEMYYLMQRVEGDKVIDVYVVKASRGDKVIVPSNYGHFSIFLSPEGIRESNWTSTSSVSDYESVKQKHGAAYYALIDKKEKDGVRWVKNKNYSYVPPLRFLAPTNFEDIGLKKNVNMYNLVRNLEKLDYLNNPQNYPQLWHKVSAYVLRSNNRNTQNELVFLKNFSSIPEAELVKNILTAHKIKSMIQKGNSAAASEFTGSVGDADLFVSKKDYEKAKKIIDDLITLNYKM